MTPCLYCGKDIPLEKKKNKFCNRSCSAKHNNIGVKRHGVSPNNCLVCGKKTHNYKSIFCSNSCYITHKWNKTKEGIIANGRYTCSDRIKKKYLLDINGNKCSICGNTEWMGKSIPLIMDHIDGNSENENADNFRLVCGNCDMQLPTYKSKNIGKGRHLRRERYKNGKSY